jgi:hypothetical protein
MLGVTASLSLYYPSGGQEMLSHRMNDKPGQSIPVPPATSMLGVTAFSLA